MLAKIKKDGNRNTNRSSNCRSNSRSNSKFYSLLAIGKMAIDKLKSVMQLLWLKKDKDNWVRLDDVRRAVYMYIGTDPRTLKNAIRNLRELGWLMRLDRGKFRIGADYMTEDF